MELRTITSMDELSELVSALTFDEFYRKIVEENHKYDKEYYEAFRILTLNRLRGIKRIVYENWAFFRKIIKIWHLMRGTKNPESFYEKTPFLPYYKQNCYEIISDETSDTRPFFKVAKNIYDNIEQYKFTYELLEDEVSKTVLIAMLVGRLTGDCRHLTDLTSDNLQYFDKDIIKAYSNEVVADIGGYIGDSSQTLLDTAEAKGKIKKIYLYEPSDDNLKQAKKTLGKYNVTIVFRKAGVFDRNGSLFFHKQSSGGTDGYIADYGQKMDKIDVVTLDEDIKEKITFIKMDIEGSEKAALHGCQRHILEDVPKLAICVYHKLDDVHWLPQYLNSLHMGYKFYLRHYSPFSMAETIMYCLPC